MTRRLVSSIALVTVAIAALPSLAAATSIAGPNGKIVFASGRANSAVPNPADFNDDAARIWVADYPGGTPVQVTTLPTGTQHRHPNWSPDHSEIVYAAGPAFVGPFALWIVNLKTGEQTEFAPAAPLQDRPTWSPDGSRIAYGSNGDLWVKGVAPGSVAEQITNTPGITEERPVWSPDGKTVYYNRGAEGNRDLYMKSPVTLAGAEVAVLADANDDWQPAVSPDGKRLCFTRGPKNDNADLWTVNVNGTGSAAEFSATAGVGDLNCVWSPDGTRILYSRGAFGAGELATRDINGGGFTFLNSMNVEKHFDGNADWATNFSPKCDSVKGEVPVNGFTTVTLSCTDPDSGHGAEPPTPEPLVSQAMEIVSPPAHGNIGSIDNKHQVIYTPNKDFTGTDTFTYAGSDEVSESAPATVTITVGKAGGGGGGDNTAPTISGLRMSPRSWRLGTKLATVSRTPIGTTISFSLSESAHATLSFKRVKRNGRTAGSAGSIFVNAKAGKNKVRFQGPLSKSRRLRPGRYRLAAVARDAAGNKSKPIDGPKFTIVPR